MKENDIRPEALMAQQKILYQEDVDRLMAQKDCFVTVACPACGSSENTQKYQKFGLNYPRCTNCGTVYVSPRPPLEVLFDFYQNSKNYQYWSEFIFPATEVIRREKIFIPRVDLIDALRTKHGFGHERFIEVGAGYGMLCEELNKRHLFDEVVAVEPTPFLAEVCRKKGITVIEKPIEQVQFNNKVDVVANFEVLEHLFSPREFLIACHNVLKVNGFLIVTCPNIEGFDVSILGESSDIIDTEHLNYFTVSSLSRLLTSIGFEVIEALTPGRLDVDIVRNKIQANDAPKLPEFLKQLVMNEAVGEQFQVFLRENQLSSNMMIVARKK